MGGSWGGLRLQGEGEGGLGGEGDRLRCWGEGGGQRGGWLAWGGLRVCMNQ